MATRPDIKQKLHPIGFFFAKLSSSSSYLDKKKLLPILGTHLQLLKFNLGHTHPKLLNRVCSCCCLLASFSMSGPFCQGGLPVHPPQTLWCGLFLHKKSCLNPPTLPPLQGWRCHKEIGKKWEKKIPTSIFLYTVYTHTAIPLMVAKYAES